MRLHELASREATLEEAFLEATGGYQEYNAEVGADELVQASDEGSVR